MKVVIDTEEKTFKLIGWVTIDELTEFVDSHSFNDYIVKIGEDSTAYDSDKVATDDDIPNPFRHTNNFDIKPPFYPTCEITSTGKGIELKDYTALTPNEPKLVQRKEYRGYSNVDVLTFSNGEEIAIAKL